MTEGEARAAADAPERVAVAKILAPHGIRGEVRAEVLSDDPARLASVGACFLRLSGGGAIQVEVVRARPGPRGSVIVAFSGIEDRDAAEKLRGALVEIPRDAVRPLPEGHIYLFELLGMEVVTEGGERVGRVTGVLRSPAHDIWEISRPEGGPPVLLPAVRVFVGAVDPAARRVVVRLPEGLLS
ncbi:MAG: ribosome maturation factor RimM [Bacillota bacterium]